MNKSKFFAIMIFSLLAVASGGFVTPVVTNRALNGESMPNMANNIRKLPTAPLGILISNPIDGETVSGTVVITTTQRCSIYIDNVRVARRTRSYSWDTTEYEDGSHTIRAVYRRTRETITVIVDNGGAPPPPPPTGGKYAVVIGISDYEGTSNDLWNPDNDASEFRQILLENDYASGDIKFLTNSQATAQNILDAIEWLVNIEGPDDEVAFFFSGHGYRAADGDGWDSDSESDRYDELIVTHDLYGLPDGMLQDEFANLESSKIAMVFCSCYSGGMFDDNDDLQGANRVITAACKANQYGWDYLNLGNTLYFYYFGDRGLLDDNADSIESAHAYAYPYVVAEQPDSQPQIYDNYPGEFYL